MEIYHGSTVIVKKPEIRIEKFNKNFYFGVYCTVMEQQAIRWATRFGEGIVNVYEYYPNDSLKTLKFEKMTEEWLDFIIACRSGIPHDWDIVEGPMADDTIYLKNARIPRLLKSRMNRSFGCTSKNTYF